MLLKYKINQFFKFEKLHFFDGYLNFNFFNFYNFFKFILKKKI